MVKQYWLNLRYITTKGQFSSFNKEHFSLNHVLCLISICFALKNLLNIQIPLGIFWNSLKQIILAAIENPIVRLDQNYMLLLSLLYVTSNSYAIRYLQLHKIKNLLKILASFHTRKEYDCTRKALLLLGNDDIQHIKRNTMCFTIIITQLPPTDMFSTFVCKYFVLYFVFFVL